MKLKKKKKKERAERGKKLVYGHVIKVLTQHMYNELN